jgi:F0F1-type ATP synthase membrane subunit b/b'
LQVELEEVTNERNRRIAEFQKQLEKEKSNYRGRLAEAERRTKEAEQKRAQLRITMEKERANWRLEADQLRHLEKK